MTRGAVRQTLFGLVVELDRKGNRREGQERGDWKAVRHSRPSWHKRWLAATNGHRVPGDFGHKMQPTLRVFCPTG